MHPRIAASATQPSENDDSSRMAAQREFQIWHNARQRTGHFFVQNQQVRNPWSEQLAADNAF
jgi:hypothetical protein